METNENHALAKSEGCYHCKPLVQQRNELAAQVERLRSEFPLFDDDGLCEHEHHCEFTLLQERKRLHGMLSETPPIALAALKAQWQAEAVRDFEAMLSSFPATADDWIEQRAQEAGDA